MSSEFEIHNFIPSWTLEFCLKNKFLFWRFCLYILFGVLSCSFWFSFLFYVFNVLTIIWYKGSLLSWSFWCPKCFLYLNGHLLPKVWRFFYSIWWMSDMSTLIFSSFYAMIHRLWLLMLFSTSHGFCLYYLIYLPLSSNFDNLSPVLPKS